MFDRFRHYWFVAVAYLDVDNREHVVGDVRARIADCRAHIPSGFTV